MEDRTLGFGESDRIGRDHPRVAPGLPARLRTPGRVLPLLLGGLLVLLTVASLAGRLYANYMVWASSLFTYGALAARLALLLIGAALIATGAHWGRTRRGWFGARRSRR
jgi:hypothetical protein